MGTSQRRPTLESSGVGVRHAPVRGRVAALDGAARVRGWFEARGLQPTEVQTRVFEALRTPGHLLVTAPTGNGKTEAVMLPLLASLDEGVDIDAEIRRVRVLYLTPVRALADAQAERIRAMAEALDVRARVEVRTGDTTTTQRAKIRRSPPEVLVTTPETLAVMLATDTRDILDGVAHVVLDEAHLLAAGKRGALLSVTLETLATLLRLRGRPAPRRLALSATARPLAELAAWVAPDARVVSAGGAVAPLLDLADPALDDAYPSAGWTWRVALPTVARAAATNTGATLVFVGARARAEQWTLALRDVLPARVTVACFHGSLSAEERGAVASGMRDQTLRVVVATSGLETGVDLPAVSRVLVLASPPSVTRLVQAAGRADHRPGQAPRATLVATSALDLVRCAAALAAARAGDLEDVDLRAYDLDVCVQAALGRVALAPCTRDELAATLRASWAFHDLDDDDLDAVIDFLATGGDGLSAYPELARVTTDGVQYALSSKRSLRRYLQAVGAIVGDLTVAVRNGTFTVGQIEGRFAAMLEVGDRFVLGARTWRVASMTGAEVQVRPDRGRETTVPSWAGARAAQSERVSAACERVFEALDAALDLPAEPARVAGVRAALGSGDDNARAVLRLARTQRATSRLPSPARFVVELVRDKRGLHVVAFTLAGSTANEVIARAVATRARRDTGLGAEVAATDECAVTTFAGLRDAPDEPTLRRWFGPEQLFEDLLDSLDGSALAGAYFREVARVSQLWTPERGRGTVTPGLLYDVLRKHDPDHVLLRALRFTLWTALDGPRAERTLRTMAARPWAVATLDAPSALSIPAFAWAERDAVRPDDPEAALAAAAHALFQRAAALGGDA
jgi:ATP-dependent Lhr-like helicase